MLYVPGNTWGFTWDSLATTDTPITSNFGVAFTCHASADTKGSYVNISTTNIGGGAVTTLGKACYWMELFVGLTGSAGAAKGYCLDVAYDPAGGTSYDVLIVSNLLVGQLCATQGQVPRYVFPVFIPAGASVGVRASSSTGGATGRAWAFFKGAPSKPDAIYYGQRVHSVGVADDGSAPTNSEGTAITPGDSGTWSSWTSLGTTASRGCFWNLAVQIRNATTTALAYHWELGYGHATTPVKIVNRLWTTFDTSERMYLTGGDAYGSADVPVGATLYARGTCSGTAETGWTAAAYGV